MALPAFHSGPPPRLASWVNKGLDWGPAKDAPLLQGRTRDLLERDISLVVVTQVMLIRRVLPCKCRPLRLWEFNPEGPRVLQHFLGMTPVEMYKLFFGPQVVCPDSTEDAGLSCNRPDTQVSSLVPGLAIRIFIIKLPLKELSFKQEWIAKAKLIRCPAPLPETMRGSRASQDVGGCAFKGKRGRGQGSYSLLEGGCPEGRNRKFLSSGEEEDRL